MMTAMTVSARRPVRISNEDWSYVGFWSVPAGWAELRGRLRNVLVTLHTHRSDKQKPKGLRWCVCVCVIIFLRRCICVRV